MYSNSSGFHMCCYCEQGIILITWTTFIFYLFSHIDVDFIQVLQLLVILSTAVPIYQQSYPFFSTPAQSSLPGHPASSLNILNINGFGRQSTHQYNHNVYGGEPYRHHYAFSTQGQHSTTYQAVSRSYRPSYKTNNFHFHYFLYDRELQAKNRQITKIPVYNPFHQKSRYLPYTHSINKLNKRL